MCVCVGGGKRAADITNFDFNYLIDLVTIYSNKNYRLKVLNDGKYSIQVLKYRLFCFKQCPLCTNFGENLTKKFQL